MDGHLVIKSLELVRFKIKVESEVQMEVMTFSMELPKLMRCVTLSLEIQGLEYSKPNPSTPPSPSRSGNRTPILEMKRAERSAGLKITSFLVRNQIFKNNHQNTQKFLRSTFF